MDGGLLLVEVDPGLYPKTETGMVMGLLVEAGECPDVEMNRTLKKPKMYGTRLMEEATMMAAVTNTIRGVARLSRNRVENGLSN